MRLNKYIIFFLIIINQTYCTEYNLIKFNKIIIWGHKLHSHTHSYIHWGFYRAFEYLGYQTLWLDKNDKINNIDFKNSLFVTEGNVDDNIPLLDDCFYVLHNCVNKKYNDLRLKNRCINLQVFLLECINQNLEKFNNHTYYSINGKIIYMPWATDLLPHEIEENKKNVLINKEKIIYWVGTIGAGVFGNIEQIEPFIKACKENKVEFIKYLCTKTMEENIQFIQRSYLAPALQGDWQIKNGYIPCRIFKNISYGQMGITNSKAVYELFDKKIIFNQDTYQLFYDAQNKLKNLDINELYSLMDFVKNNHTYLNRIFFIFKFIQLINPELANDF